MSKHDHLVEIATNAIDSVAYDRTESRNQIDESLKKLIDHIVAKIQALGIPG